MNRREKYPDTSTFYYHNANPKNRFTSDCVIRAISSALEMPYTQVVMEMAELQCKTGYDMSEKKCIDLYLKGKGWTMQKQPQKDDGTKYTGVEFCKRVGPKRNYVANLGGHHVVAIVGGKVWDTWNSTDGCIGNYWTKA